MATWKAVETCKWCQYLSTAGMIEPMLTCYIPIYTIHISTLFTIIWMEEVASMNCDEMLLQREMQGILFQKLT
jgi:hypothetical protein